MLALFDFASPDFAINSTDFLEWLGLLVAESPRLGPNDSIDPFLSRYCIPGLESATCEELVVVSWRGFIPSDWLRDLLIQCLAGNSWFSMTAHAFRLLAIDASDGFTMLRLPKGDGPSGKSPEFMSWELVGDSNRE